MALAGLLASLYRKERKLPDPKQAGAGPEVDVVDIADNGERRGEIHTQKVVKSNAEWRAELDLRNLR